MGLFGNKNNDNANVNTATQGGNLDDVNEPVRGYGTTNTGNNNMNAGTTTGYGNTAGQQGGYRDEGMGMGSGHSNNAVPGGVAQGNLLPEDERKIFGNQSGVAARTDGRAPASANNQAAGTTYGDSAVGGQGYGAGGPGMGNQHNLRHDAEGAAIGGVAGHEYDKHHAGGPGAGTGAAAGALGGHEYNKHHDNRADAGPQSNATSADHHLGTAGAAAGTAGLAEHEHHKHHHNQNAGGMGNTGAYDQNTGAYGQNTGMGNTGMGNTGMAGDRVDAGPQSNATRADHHLGTAGAATAAGGVAEHEHHKHHNNNQGAGSGNNQNQYDSGHNSGNTDADAKHLQRSGKLDKIVGTVIGSQSLKERGLQKQADAAAIRTQNDDGTCTTGNNNYGTGNNNPGSTGTNNYGTTGNNNNMNADTATGIQPSHGPGTGAVVGGGVGGGGLRQL